MKCQNCGKDIKTSQLLSFNTEVFEEIGHRQDDNEMCLECFIKHHAAIKEYLRANEWRTLQ